MDKERERGEGVSEMKQRGGGLDNQSAIDLLLKLCSRLTV